LNDATSIKDWLGRTRRDEDEIALGAVQRLAATLDQDPDAFKRGSVLPESWYAILFGTVAQESDIGPDGHPVTGDFMPPMHGTRRMFAGRRTTFHRALHVGDTVTRVSTVSRAEPKTGRTGAFTLVTVTHEMSGPSGLAITEEQDVVYRAAVEAGTTEAPKEAPRVEEKPDWSRAIVLDTVLLFRYSALTFNAHRIHYDLPYTRDVEGYPAGGDRAAASAARHPLLRGARDPAAVRGRARHPQRTIGGRKRGAMGVRPRRRAQLPRRRDARDAGIMSGGAR
jgi:3-methylfumaryl-CoA hydratase